MEEPTENRSPYIEALKDAYLRLAVGSLIVDTICGQEDFEAEVTAPQNDVEPDEVSSLKFRLLVEHVLYKASEMTATEYKRLALTDSLTGLPNRLSLRASFDDDVWSEYQANKHRSDCEVPGSLMLFDIDNFGDFNTNHGHQGGDEVLKSIAETVNESIRPEDIFGRLAGDEFVIIFPGANEERAKLAANRVVEAVRKQTKATISGGVSGIISGDFGENLHMADQALYVAKDNGRDQIATYENFLESDLAKV
jgi:diguanylate cyclase (GGDEF)-like protein